MTQVTAQLNGLRISPRKVRLVAGIIRGKSVAIALDQLAFVTKRSMPQIDKLIRSAVANAEHNLKLDRESLVITKITVDEGIKLKRFRAKGFGRSSPIHKKTSRVTVVLEDRLAVKAPVAKKKAVRAAKASNVAKKKSTE